MRFLSRLGLTMVVLIATASNLAADQLLVKEQTQLEKPDTHGGFLAFAFSPDHKLVAGGTGAISVSSGGRTDVGGGEVLLWNTETGKLLKTLGAHGGSVRWIEFSQDGKTLVSASRDNGTIKVWQLPAGRLRHTIKMAIEDKSADLRWPQLALSDDGSTLVAIGSRTIPLGEKSRVTTGGELTAWNLESGKKLWSKSESDAYVAALTPDGRGMVTVQQAISDVKRDDNGRMRFRTQHALHSWNVKTGDVIAKAELERMGRPSEVQLLDGSRVAVATGSGLAILDRKTGEATHQIKWNQERTFGDVFIGEEAKLVGRAHQGFLEIVDVASGETIGLMETEFPNHLWNAAFSSDFTRAAGSFVGASGGPVVLELEFRRPVESQSSMELSPGLRVTYFGDMKFQKEAANDIVQEPLNFLWTDAPVAGLPADRWSSRYEGYLVIAEPQEYEFHLRTDDGSRLYIDGEQVIDNWGNHAVRTRSGKILLEAGQHVLRIDHYDHLKDAHMQFLWTDPKTGRHVHVPLKVLRHEPPNGGSVAAAE